jgi:hypothetical protein
MLVTLSKASELLECDRGVMARAARDVRPIDGDEKRPLFRLSDLATALEEHRRAPDRRTREFKDAMSPELQAMFAEYERLDGLVRNAPNFVEARRRLPALLDHLATLIAAMHRDVETSARSTANFGSSDFQVHGVGDAKGVRRSVA